MLPLLSFTRFTLFQVFKNLQLFMENKEPDDDLFDRLNVSRSLSVQLVSWGTLMCSSSWKQVCVFLQTSILNKHLQELMDGLTAKVFRTYNASITLQQQLKELTNGV